ncbi:MULTISPECIES: ABC transporter ATP-binding protein [unclassified Streptomyces]|uniref:ABC transporter ATP-binding protein n=1 Tax=unclassified Streptomyces TaxID=2593676 RepID=UPI001BAE8EBD|nr:ABC transporter ATP-binding protein [Streptomyces sp. A2-16]QUC59248.1 ABC transporter ATP-binding protein [Streptomyces sp. A2-16]
MAKAIQGMEKETVPGDVAVAATTVAAPGTEPAPGRGAALRVEGAGISFGDFQAVQGIDLDIPAGEFLCLLGPSGCGKSTLLSAMAGFTQVSEGTLTANGAPVRGPHPELGMVFQSSEALFDWLTVQQNVTFGPRMRGMSRAEQNRVADEYLGLVGLRHCADRYPGQLSGGMRQRVQIARVLANEPGVVLMDEPFGALDAQTRQVLQQETARIWSASGCTIVFVTHDIDEAILLADRVAVMTAGPAASIKSLYTVDLPRPRNESDPAALRLRNQLREDIGEEVRKAMRDQGLDDQLDREAKGA